MGAREFIKTLLRRAVRPGLTDVTGGVDRVEQAAAELARLRALAASQAVWRGGLDGAAIGSDGRPAPAMTAKLRGELAYWVEVARGRDASFPGDFIETFTLYQRHRLGELAHQVGLTTVDDLAAWAAERNAVEIGGGPLPSVAMLRWKSCVGVDPLNAGYCAERIVPPAAAHVTLLAAPGECVPLPSSAADIVICENCLDHVEAPAQVSGEIARLLRPGGIAWLLVDFMDFSDSMHPNPMNQARLNDLLAGAGLVVRYTGLYDCVSHPRAEKQCRVLAVRPRTDGTLPAIVPHWGRVAGEWAGEPVGVG